ncbi:MAG: aminotransferase class I/II-fold pyridoxal phosphate-dependent enzyme [Anaerolineales bacterium]|nr:aminotransferase class I/II-fold pyridoxal phosphate-dependent enzyme [Anaerolineales bacterium]
MSREFIAGRVATLKPSGIRKFFDIVATMDDVISLGIGEPDFTTPKPILEAGIKAIRNGETHYTSNAGIYELREAISDLLEEKYQVCYDPADEVVVTVGVSEALYLALTAVINPGEEVIIPTPCFVSYQAEVILAGGVPIEVPGSLENNFQPDPGLIEAAITPQTKAIFIGFPNNPTGAVATRENLLKISQIAEEHDLLVISDEIYDSLVYGVEHVCFAALPGMKERTITLGGFSKSYAMTGWRVGYATAPAEILDGLVRIHQYTVMSAPSMSQLAALAALQHGADFAEEMRVKYDRRRKLIVSRLNDIGLETFMPQGAFYAFPKITCTGLDDDQFAQKLLKEEKVAVVPGSAFGAGGAGFVRCSYATRYEKIEEALDRIESFVKRCS